METAVHHDIISTIDEALGCGNCGGPLTGRPSDYFCSPRCQARWSAARAEPLTSYTEPDDQAVHVANLVELHSPETCVACVEGRHRRNAIDSAMATALAYGSSYVVVDEVAGFLVPSRNAQQHFLNDRIQAAPAETYERRGQAWMPVAPTAADLTLPPGQSWQDVGTARELVSFGFDPATSEGGGSIAVVTRRDRVDHVAVVFSPGLVVFPPELGERMRAVAEEIGQAWADAWSQIAPTVEQVARLLPEVPPEDPRERALWLRRNRNTGPSASARAPRAINPRRGR